MSGAPAGNLTGPDMMAGVVNAAGMEADRQTDRQTESNVETEAEAEASVEAEAETGTDRDKGRDRDRGAGRNRGRQIQSRRQGQNKTEMEVEAETEEEAETELLATQCLRAGNGLSMPLPTPDDVKGETSQYGDATQPAAPHPAAVTTTSDELLSCRRVTSCCRATACRDVMRRAVTRRAACHCRGGRRLAPAAQLDTGLQRTRDPRNIWSDSGVVPTWN